MKIQFIVCGWWYDEFDGRKGITDFIDGLIELQKDNDFVDVFWTCHKEPTKLIKDNFKYKVFENVGLEWGAYNKAFDYLDLDDDTIVFCIQDDMVIKDWCFVSVCVKYINKPLTYGDKDGKEFLLIDPYGNTSLYLNAYKFTKYFGKDKMKWLSNEYRRSPYMIECGRGIVDLPQDKDTPSVNLDWMNEDINDFLIDGPVEYKEDINE